MVPGIIAIVVVVLLVLWAITGYNRFVKLRNTVQESWKQIDVELTRSEIVDVRVVRLQVFARAVLLDGVEHNDDVSPAGSAFLRKITEVQVARRMTGRADLTKNLKAALQLGLIEQRLPCRYCDDGNRSCFNEGK